MSDTENIKKDKLMEAFHINEADLSENKAIVIEKLFCGSILKQGVDITSKVLDDYIKTKDILYPDSNIA